MNAHELVDQIEASLPHTLTILCTYQCTAACKQCCFESSPRVKGRLSLDSILARISEAKKSFQGLRLVVFSGGEAFLLKDDLYAAVSYATSLGLMTRIVTNASWGKTEEAANSAVRKLLEAGITEINISTGLDHQEWVPLSSITNAARALTSAGIRTLITVESDSQDSDRMNELRQDASITQSLRSGHLSIQGNSWMPFTADAIDRDRPDTLD